MKSFLLSTTSSAALFVTFASGAVAGGMAEPINDPVVIIPPAFNGCAPSRILELKGGSLSTDNVWAGEDVFGQNASDKLGLGYAHGAFGEAEYTWDRCDSDLSIGAGFANTNMSESKTFVDGSLGVTDDVSFQHIDLEYGRSAGNGIRLFGGARILNYDSHSTARLGTGGTSFEKYGLKASFLGIGPRLGVEFNTVNRKKGAFGFFGEASLAALFGKRSNDFWYDNDLGAHTSQGSQNSNELVMNFEAELGVSYNVSSSSVVNAGVAYKRLNDIDWISDDPTTQPLKTGDREFLGVFVGFEKHF